jgi:hypothetical protein
VVVLDQEGQRNAWVRLWEETTLATKYPTFSVSIKDMTGTHEKDLVCAGMNDLDRQTLLVLHPDRQGGPGVPAYGRIAAIEAESIEIVETERSPAYAAGLADEAPWEIRSHEQDLTSRNYMDKVETRWTWNPAAASYMPAERRQVSGQAIEQALVERYLDGNPSTFERFLSGIWYLESGPPPGVKGARLIQFSPEFREIVFSEEGDVPSLSVFNWENSASTKRGLYISAAHQEIKLRRFVDIELLGAESVQVRSTDNVRFSADSGNPWNGAYRKYIAHPSEGGWTDGADTAVLPSGCFQGPQGELEFAYPRYTWKRDGSLDSGLFSAYAMDGTHVLVLRSLSPSGMLTRTRSYAMKGGGAGGEAALILSPVRISVEGLEYLEAEQIVFSPALAPPSPSPTVHG